MASDRVFSRLRELPTGGEAYGDVFARQSGVDLVQTPTLFFGLQDAVFPQTPRRLLSGDPVRPGPVHSEGKQCGSWPAAPTSRRSGTRWGL